MSEILEHESREDYQKISWGPREEYIPLDWDLKNINEISKNVIYPQRDKPKDLGGEVPWIRIEDLDGKYISESDSGKGVTRETIQEMNLSVFPSGTLMCSCSGNMGICAITERELISNQTFAGIVPSENVDIEYLYYCLENLKDDLQRMSTGTTIPYLSSDKLKRFSVPYPSLPEQHRIADILSTVDEQIQQTDELIEETKALKRGLMQDLLTRGIGHDDYEEQYLGPRRLEIPAAWKKARLEEVSEIITRGKQPTYVDEGGVPVLNQSCIYWDGFHPEELKRLDSEVADGWKDKYWVKEGDVLINSTGKGTLGRALEWSKESDTHALDSHITRVHPDESVLDPTYFRFYLESNHGQKMLYAFCVAGSTGQIELSKTDLQTMPILLPPVEEQREISEAFHRVNKKLQDEQETKEELQNLKRGLMQDLLTGKVRVDAD